MFDKSKNKVSGFLHPRFSTLADEIVNQIKLVENIRKANVIINFSSTKRGNIKVSLDLIGRVEEGPYINEGFLGNVFAETEIPKYIFTALTNKELERVSLSEEDLESIYDYLQLKLEHIDTIDWSGLQSLCDKASGEFVELSDKVFFTIANIMDENKTSKKTFKIGILNDLPEDIYGQLYPFKEVLIKL